MTTQPVVDDFAQLDGTIATFLGFRPSSSDLSAFPFQIYSFLIRRIRLLDEKLGKSLIRRFLEGPQEVWAQMDLRSRDLYDLFNPALVEAAYLPSLRKLVGFGDDLLDVVNAASENELRSLIEGAIDFWGVRGTRNGGFRAALNIVTGNRYKIRDYFSYRFILGETWIMEELEDLDPFMIDVETVSRFQTGTDGATRFGGNARRFSSASAIFEDPEDVDAFIVIQDQDDTASNGFYRIGSIISSTEVEVLEDFPTAETNLTWFIAFHYDEFLTEIRVVDDLTGDGAINRTFLEKLLETARPNSERVNVVYVSFMDLFTTDGDLGQWEFTLAGKYTTSFADGVLSLANPGFVTPGFMVTDYFGDSTWKNYSLKAKIKYKDSATHPDFNILFLRTDDLNYYFLTVQPSSPTLGTMELWRVVGGSFTQLGSTVAFSDLAEGVYFTYTIDAFRDESTNLTHITVRVDGNVYFSESDGNFDTGNFGFEVSRFGQIDIDEVELWQYPLTIDRVGPNP